MNLSALSLGSFPLLIVLAGCAGATPSETNDSESEGALGEARPEALRGSWGQDKNSGLILLGDGKTGAFLRDLEGHHAEGTYVVDLATKRITFSVTSPRARTEIYGWAWGAGSPPQLSIQQHEQSDDRGGTKPSGDNIRLERVTSWCDASLPDLGLNECFAAYKDGSWGTTEDNQTFAPIKIDACRSATDAKSAKSCMACDARTNACVATR